MMNLGASRATPPPAGPLARFAGAVMGIYDREYYRDDSGGFGLLSGVAPACKVLILVNVAVFLAQWVLRGLELEYWLTASVEGVFQQGRVWQLLTAAFFHVDPIHILINMWVLWVFGREVESYYGTRDFTALYLAAAVVGTLAWAAVDALDPHRGGVMLGASGAVTAIFTVYALFHPNRQVLLFFVLPMPIWLILAIFLGLDALMLLQQLAGGAASGGVAFAAHLGGAAFGYLFKTYDLRPSRLIGERPRLRPRLRTVFPDEYPAERDRDRDRERRPTTGAGSPLAGGQGRSAAGTGGAPSIRPAAPPAAPPEGLDERLDEVLAKIAREGRAGLTDEENLILQEASRRARDRRSERIR
jgi:membrane associated rhomboid family serine protease